jgi:hypothetical protein
MQVVGGLNGCVLELQEFAAVCASLYKTKFALPWRPAIFWTIRAMIPAKAGEEAEVPPAPPIVKGPLAAHDGVLPAETLSASQNG